VATYRARIPPTGAHGALEGPDRGVLVGREHELAALREALERARGGVAVAVAVSGEPGIGKSRLLAELAALGEEAGCLVLSGRAGEFERGEPFGVFRDALDDYAGGLEGRLLRRLGPDVLGELAACLPALAASGHEPQGVLESERYRTHRALRALLESLAVDRALVLVLDDLHWCDEPSLELFEALLRRRPRGRVLIACALRPRQAPRRLAEALAEEVVLVEPAALDLEGARALLSGPLDDAQVRALHGESGGVPFYLHELARAAQASPARPPGAERSVGELPRAVARALQGELECLPGPAGALLRAAAVAGDPFELHLATAAAGLAEEDSLVSLDELVERDLVRATAVPRRLAFRHPLVRHAVYQSASPSFRIAAHGRAAAALEAAGAGAGARAHHVAASAAPGDRQAAALLADAGHAAAARAPAVAAHWLDEALRLLPGGDPNWRLGVLAARARALVAAGHLEDGLQALGEALSLAPVEATELRVALTVACAQVETVLGRHAQASARVRAALDALPEPGSVQAGALHLQLAVTLGVWSNHPGELVAHADRGLAAARRAGDDMLAATACALLALGELGVGRFDAAGALVAEAGALLDGCDDGTFATRIDAPQTLGHAACYVERFADALRWLERGIAVSRQTGQNHMLVPLMNGHTLALATLGRLAAADEVASAAVEAAHLGANTQVLAWALRQRCWVSLLAGELPDALRAGTKCVELLRRLEPSAVGASAGWMVGHALMEAGEPVRAIALILELEGGEELPHNNPPGRCIAYEILTRAALAAGRTDEAADWAARAEASATGLGEGLWAGLARRARAAVLLERGEARAAAQAALEAAAGAQRSGARIETARARLLAGRALARAGDREDALAELERAEAELSDCGAKRLRDEAANELRALGKRVARPTGTRASAGRALDELTPRERQVAELVATGQANKQIAATLHVSVNTVESHLKRIFAKLEVNNRAALAAVLTSRREDSRSQ